MKLLALFLICVSASAAIRLGYESNNRYTYEYEAILIHGIPEALEDDMAVKVSAIAHLDYLAKDNIVMLRLEEVEFKTMTGKLLKVDRVGELGSKPTSHSQVEERVKSCLEMPIKFRFKGNELERELFASKYEPIWCLNMHRGLIGHLYLPIEDNEELYQTSNDEVSVVGKCKTSYTIVNKEPYYKVKKVIDLSACSERGTDELELLQHNMPNMDKFFVPPKYWSAENEENNATYTTYSSSSEYPSPKGRGSSKSLPSFVRSAAYIDYDLQPVGDSRFLISTVVSESEHDFTMFGDNYRAGKAVGARTRQMLKLIAKQLPIPSDAKPIKEEEKRGGLMFVYDDGSDVTSTEEAQKNILAKVFEKMAELKRQLTEPVLKPEVARSFAILVSALRKCDAKRMESILESCLEEKDIDVKKVFLDAVARTGTFESVSTIKEFVDKKKISDERLGRVLFGIGWVRSLEAAAINQVMEICKLVSGKPEPAQQLERTCWMSFGTLVNRLMVAVRSYPRVSADPKILSFRNLFSKTLCERVTGERAEKDMEVKLTFIKASGNAGYVSSDLRKTISDHAENTDMPLHVRVQAVWSLRHMVRVEPKKIRESIMPIFVDPLNDPELRIACYKILISSDPSLTTCQFIAGVIGREVAKSGPRSNQVVSFIASDIRSSLNLDPFNPVMTSRARLILRFIPRESVFGLFAYSKSFKFAVGSAERPAMEIQLNKINGRQTFLPRHLSAKSKLHLPGLSADFIEFGARMQGIHDILQPLFETTTTRPKRSLDMLNFLFGRVMDSGEVKKNTSLDDKLPARFSTYLKLFGSEVYYGKAAKGDLEKILTDALFGDGKATEGGITFSNSGIKYRQPFTRAHMLSEARCFIPTLTGIPLKISHKTAVALKGLIEVEVTGTPKLMTSKYEKIEASVKVMPSVALHMHNKVSAWLPIFESGIIVKNDILASPKLHVNVVVKKGEYHTEFPIATADRKVFELSPKVSVLVRKELTPGIGEWSDIGIVTKPRGMLKLNKTCYGGEWLGVAACVEREIVDRGYMRTERLPTFPYYLLDNINVVLTNKEDAPSKLVCKYNVITNDAKTYNSNGELSLSGNKTERRTKCATKCDKDKMTCEIDWKFFNKYCPAEGCKAVTKADTSEDKKISITHEQGEYSFTSDITFEKDETLMRMINTWSKLPKRIQDFVYYYHPHIMSYIRGYFSMEIPEKEKNAAGECKISVHLHDKFTADIYVDLPELRLHRINQVLPFSLPKFPTSKIEVKAIFDYSRYGTCVVRDNNYIKTTDNIVIDQQIPSACPLVLAQDSPVPKNGGEPKKPEWKISLKLNKEKHRVMIEVKTKLITLDPDMSVMVNGEKVEVEADLKLPGVLISRTEGKLYVKADVGFECLFDGSQTLVNLIPWLHNRVRGVCGNNDGEDWTDMITRRSTFIPETLPREFLREWVEEGKNCNDKSCNLKPKHIKLANSPSGYECFTNGRFLRCMSKCTPEGTPLNVPNVAHHCLPSGSPLIARINEGDRTVNLENMSIDMTAPVAEDISCKCSCS